MIVVEQDLLKKRVNPNYYNVLKYVVMELISVYNVMMEIKLMGMDVIKIVKFKWVGLV